MEEILKAFEGWLAVQVENGYLASGYTDRERDLLWNAWFSAWCMSVDSIVITLPDPMDYTYDEVAFQAIRDCEVAINSAGVKTE